MKDTGRREEDTLHGDKGMGRGDEGDSFIIDHLAFCRSRNDSRGCLHPFPNRARVLWHHALKSGQGTCDVMYSTIHLIAPLPHLLPSSHPPPLSLQLNMAGATDESNEKHLEPWSVACQRDGITNTPLSPYIDQELLYNRHLHIDPTKIEGTGFKYEVPCVAVELLKEVRGGV